MDLIYKINALIIVIVVLLCMNCVGQKDSTSFKNRLSLNFMVTPTYINSFNNRVRFYAKDHTRNIGKGIRIGASTEYKFTARKAIRVGIYYYSEVSNFELLPDNPGIAWVGFDNYGFSYFYRIKQLGIEFPIDYKYIAINKYDKVKIYFVGKIVLSYFFKQDEIFLNNGGHLVTDHTQTTNKFEPSGLFRLTILQPGISYKISEKIKLFFEVGYAPSENSYRAFQILGISGINRNRWSAELGINSKL